MLYLTSFGSCEILHHKGFAARQAPVYCSLQLYWEAQHVLVVHFSGDLCKHFFSSFPLKMKKRRLYVGMYIYKVFFLLKILLIRYSNISRKTPYFTRGQYFLTYRERLKIFPSIKVINKVEAKT